MFYIYLMSIKCGHCEKYHSTVKEVKLCSDQDRLGRQVSPLPQAAKVHKQRSQVSEPKPSSQTENDVLCEECFVWTTLKMLGENNSCPNCSAQVDVKFAENNSLTKRGGEVPENSLEYWSVKKGHRPWNVSDGRF